MGKLEAVRTTESLAELVEKSGILTAKQLEQAKAVCQESADLKSAALRMVNEKLINRWQANQLLRGFTKLVRGKFKLLGELGGSGLSRVFLAEHGQLGRRVAYKTLSGQHKNDPEAVKNFRAQAQHVATLDHRNLIHVYDIGTEGDQDYVVSEYAEGVDLGKLAAKQGSLPVEQVADLVRQTAAGLAHAHERGVWHSDLKPSNLIIDQQNTLKILDIGVAKLSESIESPSAESAPEDASDIGPFFRAPEQQDRPGEVGAAADIFSLGGVLYFLLTRRPPMARLVDGKWMRDEKLAPVESLRADVPEEIRELCLKMLQADPKQRLQSASEVEKAISNWQATQTESSALDSVAAPPPVQSPTAAGSFTPKSGPPPVRKPMPKAKLLVAKPLAEEPAATDASEDSDAAADSSPSISINVNKPTAKAKKSDSNEEEPASAFSIDVGKTSAKNKKAPSSENIPSATETPAFSVNAGKPAAKSKKPAASEKVPTASEEPSFSIDVGKSTTKDKKSKESISISKDESVDDPSLAFGAAPKSSGSKGKSSTKVSAKKKSSKAGGSGGVKMSPQKVVILAGSAAAVLMVLLLSGVVYWFLSGGKDKVVAKATPESTEVEKDDESKTEDKKMPEETSAVADEKPAAKVDEPANKPEKPDELANVEAKKPDAPDPLPAPTDPLPIANPVTALKPEISTPEPSPATPKPMPEAVAVNTPSPPKPAPKPAVANPFEGFIPEITLPDVASKEALEPLELGTVKIDKKALCIMQLLGNDFAMKGGKQKYAIDAGDGGTSLRDWDIFIRDAAAENGGTKIAALGLHDDKLTFTWQKEAIAQKQSPYLCNCILQMSAGPKSHSLALRKVIEKEPTTLDLSKLQTKRESFRIPLAPDPKKIHVRLSIDGTLAKYRFDPKNELDADKDYTFIAFSPNDADWILKIKVDALMKSDLSVTLIPMFHFPGSMQKPEPLTVGSMKGMPKKNDPNITIMQQQIDQGKKTITPKSPAFMQQELARAEDNLRNLIQNSVLAEQLEAVIKSVSGSAKIHYEVVYKTDLKELVLVTTHPPGAKTGKK